MAAASQRVLIYRDARGREPFTEWHAALAGSRAHRRILARLNRLRLGNFGDCKPVGGGVLELRIDYGPGYRVVVARDGGTPVVLLCGGDKSSQRDDIAAALRFWREYKETR